MPLSSVTKTNKVVKPSNGVSFIRKDLAKWLDVYYVIRDVLDGEYAMKAAGHKYLPVLNPTKVQAKDPVAVARNEEYITRAVFYNFTFRTQQSLVGAIFLRPPMVEVPDLLDNVIRNADGEGLSLEQLAKKACSDVLAYGRGGLLTDYPPTTKATTKADAKSGKVRPFIKFYEPWNIINWRTEMGVNSENVLTLVVLREHYDEDIDGFEVRTRTQYRELRLEKNQVIVKVWRPKKESEYSDCIPSDIRDEKAQEYKVYSTHTINGGDGKPLDRIPFDFIGAKNNDTFIDHPPMYDMATLNCGHWRNSADHEESVFMLGQPTPVVIGLTDDWAANHLKGELALGSRGIIPLPEKADAKLLQAEPNTLAFEAMKHKENQAKKMGAKLIEERNVEKTATESEIDSASDNSVLRDVTQNVGRAFVIALQRSANFLNLSISDDEIKYELNDNFDLTGLAAEEQRWLIELVAANLLSIEEARTVLRRSGMATLDIEEFIAKIKEDQKLKDELVPQLERDAAEAAKVAAANPDPNQNSPKGNNDAD